jgi:hypothetical protein
METSNIVKLMLAIIIVVVVLRLSSEKFTGAPLSSGYAVNGPAVYDAVVAAGSTKPPGPTPPPNITGPPISVSADLLPKPNESLRDFSEFAPKSLTGQNFLSPDKYVGLNTQGSSLRNASWDLRSDIPNPRMNVSVWGSSTIDADLLRRPLE